PGRASVRRRDALAERRHPVDRPIGAAAACPVHGDQHRLWSDNDAERGVFRSAGPARLQRYGVAHDTGEPDAPLPPHRANVYQFLRWVNGPSRTARQWSALECRTPDDTGEVHPTALAGASRLRLHATTRAPGDIGTTEVTLELR